MAWTKKLRIEIVGPFFTMVMLPVMVPAALAGIVWACARCGYGLGRDFVEWIYSP